MKDNIQKTLAQARWGNILLIFFGVILIIHPDFASGAVAAMIAWVLIVIGGIGLISSVLTWPVFGFGTMAGSGLITLLGIYLIHNPLSLASVIGVCLGAVLTVQGLSALGDAIRIRRNGGIWSFGMGFAVITLIVGLVLIFSPMTTSRVVMSVIGIIMILCGIGNLHTRRQVSRYPQKQGKSRIIDADP